MKLKNCVIIFVFAILFILIMYDFDNSEYFSNMNRYLKYNNTPDYTNNSFADNLWTGRLASDCYDKSLSDCTKYTNCGVCESGSKKECVPGDIEGPLFKEGCDRWGYVDYYDSLDYTKKYLRNRDSLDSNKGVYSNTIPWGHFYPEYEAWYPSPTALVY